MQDLASDHFPNKADKTKITQDEVLRWVGSQAPGVIIKNFICKVLDDRTGLSPRKQEKLGVRPILDHNLSLVRQHLDRITNKDFDAHLYTTRGYYLQGSITTDGTKLMITVFKLRELSSVKYKRLAEDRMPDRIISTVAGLKDFLTEVRHVFPNDEAFRKRYGNILAKAVSILGIDLGKQFVAAAHALLPENEGKNPPVFPNLTIKTKATYQPLFKFQEWLEEQVNAMSTLSSTSTTSTSTNTMSTNSLLPIPTPVLPPQSSSRQSTSQPTSRPTSYTLSQIMSSLPPLKGPNASFTKYMIRLDEIAPEMDAFFGSKRYSKRLWDLKKAQEAEYSIMTDSLLKMVGGSIGRQIREDERVLIAIGNSNFSSNKGLPSRDGSFLSFFVQTVSRYLVVILEKGGIHLLTWTYFHFYFRCDLLGTWWLG